MKTISYLVLILFALFALSCDGKIEGIGSSGNTSLATNDVLEDEQSMISNDEGSEEILNENEEIEVSSDNQIDGTSILGKWNAAEMKMVGSANEDGISMEFDGTTSSVGGNNYIEFSTGNTFLAQNSVMQMEMNFNIPGMGKMSRTIPINNDFSESGKWSKNGDLLRIHTPGGEVIDYVIEQLTSKLLVISADENSIVTGDDIPPGAKMKITMVFER